MAEEAESDVVIGQDGGDGHAAYDGLIIYPEYGLPLKG
jgi:hypothetical protein